MNLSYLALIEIFRDFVQLVSITVVSLGIHIDFPMKFSFVSISDWLSINFILTLKVDVKAIMGAQLLLLLISTSYLIFIALKEVRKKFQGQEAKSSVEQTKFQKYFSRIAIFLITTIFAPLVQTSLKVFANTIENVEEGDIHLMRFMGVVSLVLLIIVNPVLFYFGIKNTLPKSNRFDTTGQKYVDDRELYFIQMKKHHNPFKELYQDYSYKGAYYKLIMMMFKFLRMCLMISKPSPFENFGAFWGLYVADIVANCGFIYMNVQLLPFHDFQSNRSAILGFINQILIIILNMILLLIDDEEAKNFIAQRTISIIQLVFCCVIFLFYYLKTFFGGSSLVTKLFKTLFKRFTFTSIRRRGIYNLVGLKDRYLDYIYFNKQYYNKEAEIQINIWEEFWNNLIQKDRSLKSDIPVEQLAFINPGNTPPYLRNFRGSVEERLEENTRIMQKIGKEQYLQELKNYKNEQYLKLILDIFQYVPPVDAYYFGQEKETSGFCKVSYFPFPFTLQLAFDGKSEMVEITGFEKLSKFVQFMKSDQYKQMREFRTILRSLSGQKVNHTITKQVSRRKHQNNQSYMVNATVTYTEGIFKTTSDIEALAQLNNGVKIDVGKGLICSLFYAIGEGNDEEGERFTGEKLLVSHDELGINYFNRESGRIHTLIVENFPLWNNNFQLFYNQYGEYLMNIVMNINKKAEILSYDFNIKVLSAPYESFINKEATQQLLLEEKNPIINRILITHKEKFDELFDRLQVFDQNDYKAYQFLFFKDLWTLNQDLSVIKKNEDLFNPYQKNCLIYKSDLTIQDWKKIFIHKGLRSKSGKRGYFNNRILCNFQKMLDIQSSKPDNFIDQDDLLSVNNQNSKNVKVKPLVSQQEQDGNQQRDVYVADIEQPENLIIHQKQQSETIQLNSQKRVSYSEFQPTTVTSSKQQQSSKLKNPSITNLMPDSKQLNTQTN